MSSGSNGVDREHSLWKIPTRLRGTNFCINCTISARFAPSFARQQNSPKCIQTVRNIPKHEFRVQWGWIWSVRCEKFRHNFVAQTFTLIAPFQPGLHRVSMGNETVPKGSKQYETHKNMSSGSNGVDRECLLRKILTQLRGTNFCTSSARFTQIS